MIKHHTFLEKVHIQNYLSLCNIEFQLSPLTILVGPNASGKSNTLSSLRLLNQMLKSSTPPDDQSISESVWAGKAEKITFELQLRTNNIRSTYKIELQPQPGKEIALEQLKIDQKTIIAVTDGLGEVRDEDNPNQITPYHPSSPKIALKSAGDYGGKPITRAISQFISDWEFYNFEPAKMRDNPIIIKELIKALGKNARKQAKNPSNAIDNDGSIFNEVLTYWATEQPELFQSVSDSLASCTNLKIERIVHEDDINLYLQEGYDTLIPLWKASDGTLRLIAYYILLNQPKIPSLIAIEEPERNLHPAALADIATVLEQLSEKTQVIITTHSSQLLDAFNPELLSNKLTVLLLHNIPGEGTKIINLAQAQHNRSAFAGWITDFGIGSAIFNSELLQDLTGA